MNNKPIGVFDSGIGGLTVLNNLIKELPNEHYIYIGDNKNCPYGDKTKEELFCYASSIIDYFIVRDVKLIVVGCNTVSSSILPLLYNKYPNIKIIGIIDSTVNLLIKSKSKKALVIATKATINSHAYKKNIEENSSVKVIELATPSLVPLIEDGLLKEASLALNNYLDQVDDDYDSIVMGCTHYGVIDNIPNNKTIISSSDGIVNDVGVYLNNNNLYGKEKKIEIYTTGDVLKFISSSKTFFNYNNNKVKQLKLH